MKASKGRGKSHRKTAAPVNVGGRPPLPPEVKLSERVNLNLSRSERAALLRVLGEGETEAGYVRRVLVKHLRGKGERT